MKGAICMKITKMMMIGIAGLCFIANANAQRLGETVEKEITVQDKNMSLQMEFIEITEYDKKGNIIRKEWPGADTIMWEIYEYDSRGNLVKKSESKFPNQDYIYKYTFNQDGLITSQKDYTYDKTTKSYKDAGETSYEYDALGNNTYCKAKYNGSWSESWYGWHDADMIYWTYKSGDWVTVRWYEYMYRSDGCKIRCEYKGYFK